MTPNIESKTILYIDDDELSALLVDRVLRIRGYKIVHQPTGLEGLEVAKTVAPHLILININLPDLNRRVITAHLRRDEQLAGAPLIALVSLGGEEAREISTAFGCDGYITKPIDTERLPGQIEHFLSQPPQTGNLLEENAYLPAYNAQLVQKLENRVRELTEANQALLTSGQRRASLFDAVSNELQVPLHPIKDHVKRFLNGSYGELKREQHQALETISRYADLLSYYMADLTYLSRFEANRIIIHPEPFDFNELLNEIIAAVETFFEQSVVRFTYNIDNHLPKMYADRDGIRHVILHLLNDVVKSAQQDVVTLTARIEDDNVLVSISDTGDDFLDSEANATSWLPENELDTAGDLEPGLFISKHMIKAHKGKVWVNFVQGQGMRYTFMLPYDQGRITNGKNGVQDR